MVINNEILQKDSDNIIEMLGLKEIVEDHKKRKKTQGKGPGLVKQPGKKELIAMLEQYVDDNQQLTDCLFKAGLILCAVHKSTEKIFNDMGGSKLISPGMERHKKHIAQIVEATETYKDWDKIDVTEPEGKGPDSNQG